MTETPEVTKRRTRADGQRTRQLILDAAVRLATVEGLDGSGTFTCDDEVLAVQVEGGVPATFDRVG